MPWAFLPSVKYALLGGYGAGVVDIAVQYIVGQKDREQDRPWQLDRTCRAFGLGMMAGAVFGGLGSGGDDLLRMSGTGLLLTIPVAAPAIFCPRLITNNVPNWLCGAIMTTTVSTTFMSLWAVRVVDAGAAPFALNALRSGVETAGLGACGFLLFLFGNRLPVLQREKKLRTPTECLDGTSKWSVVAGQILANVVAAGALQRGLYPHGEFGNLMNFTRYIVAPGIAYVLALNVHSTLEEDRADDDTQIIRSVRTLLPMGMLLAPFTKDLASFSSVLTIGMAGGCAAGYIATYQAEWQGVTAAAERAHVTHIQTRIREDEEELARLEAFRAAQAEQGEADDGAPVHSILAEETADREVTLQKDAMQADTVPSQSIGDVKAAPDTTGGEPADA